jgi:hypothetical protein
VTTLLDQRANVGIPVAGGWFAYAPALGAPFLLDDFSNLGGLASVAGYLHARQSKERS